MAEFILKKVHFQWLIMAIFRILVPGSLAINIQLISVDFGLYSDFLALWRNLWLVVSLKPLLFLCSLNVSLMFSLLTDLKFCPTRFSSAIHFVSQDIGRHIQSNCKNNAKYPFNHGTVVILNLILSSDGFQWCTVNAFVLLIYFIFLSEQYLNKPNLHNSAGYFNFNNFHWPTQSLFLMHTSHEKNTDWVEHCFRFCFKKISFQVSIIFSLFLVWIFFGSKFNLNFCTVQIFGDCFAKCLYLVAGGYLM